MSKIHCLVQKVLSVKQISFLVLPNLGWDEGAEDKRALFLKKKTSKDRDLINKPVDVSRKFGIDQMDRDDVMLRLELMKSYFKNFRVGNGIHTYPL